MKLTILAFICMGIAYVKGDCVAVPETFPEGCWDDPNMAKIDCPTGEDVCTCTPGTDFPDACSTLTPGTVADMDRQTCKVKCQELEGCVFYRWELDSDVHCSLMNDAQCMSYEPCSVEHCISGQIDCETGDNPDPVGEPCKSGATFVSGNIHWKCINPFDEEQDRIDIYKDTGSSILPGTICYTDRKCLAFDEPADDKKEDPDFLYHTLVVQCGASSPGLWGKYAQSTNKPDAGITSDSTLTDPECKLVLDDLHLDKTRLTEPGVSFICSDGDNLHWTDENNEGEVLVTDPNTCALLCNFHQTMTIEPKFNEKEGINEWWLYPTGEGIEGELATKENVHCWTL